MTTEAIVGWSALVAAAATVIGAVFLILFFAKGGLWGLLNDVASIVLMLATIPVALGIASATAGRVPWAYGAALVGIVGMVGASVAQGLLVTRRFSFERLLPWTLGFGAIVGAWYLLIGFAGARNSLFKDGLISLDTLAIASGLGFIAVGYGFWRGNERHPLSIVGGIVLLVASTWFLAWIGLLFLSGDIYAA